MNRAEAVSIIKEIFSSCQLVESEHISLIPPALHNAVARGFQVEIKTRLSNNDRLCVEAILQKHNFALKEKPEFSIIYEP